MFPVHLRAAQTNEDSGLLVDLRYTVLDIS
jgi:hypothetical protein